MLLRFQRVYVEPGIRVYSPGDELDIANDELARAYIHHGIAVEVPQAPAETAELAIDAAPAIAEHAVPRPRRRETRKRA